MERKDREKLREKRRMYRKKPKTKRLQFSLFKYTLLIMFIVGLIIPLRPKVSAVEKRELTKFPSFSIEKFMNGEYLNQISTWYADTFPFREKLIDLNSSFKNLYGINDIKLISKSNSKADKIPDKVDVNVSKKENKEKTKTVETVEKTKKATESKVETNKETIKESKKDEKFVDGTIYDVPESAGDVYVIGDRAFSVYYFSKESADSYIAMADFIQKQIPNVKFYDVLVPTSAGVNLDDKVINQLGASSQKNAIDYIYKGINQLNSNIITVNAYDEIKKHNNEYLYFRTDHHWTHRGTYYAYKAFMEAKGEKPKTLDEFEKVEFKDFVGTFYASSNQVQSLKNNPDTVEAYKPSSTNEMVFYDENQNAVNWPVITDVTDWDAGAKYQTFIGGDNMFALIDNPKNETGNNLLLIKESYGNAIAPFLVDHYDKIFVVDYRYFNRFDKYNNKIINLIKENNIKDVMLINNADAMTSEIRIKQIEAMFR